MPQLHIFKPGAWTTMAGETIEFSAADLEATAKAYSPSACKAPIVIGHPKTDDPAQGWVNALAANARGLFAQTEKVDPAFAESVRAGRYGTVSAKFYRPTDSNNPVPGVWYLRHVGVLGAQNPAVKGLDAPQFSDADDGCVCFREGVAFSDYDAMTSAGLFRNLREWMLGKFGADETDKVLPGYEVRALEIGAQDDINRARLNDVATPAFSAPDLSTPQESTVTEAEAAQLRTQNAELLSRVQAAEAATTAHAAQTRQAANVAFAEKLAQDGTLIADEIPMAVALQSLAEPAQGAAAIEFGEGDDKKPMLEAVRGFLSGLPKRVKTGEQATRDRAAPEQEAADVAFAEGADPDRLKQHKAALAYQKEHKTSYVEAARAVIK